MINSKRILVTGGAGFIGSHLCDALIQSGNEIVVVDDLSSGYEENIAHLSEKIEFYEETIETIDLRKIKKINGVIHLAAQTSVPLSIENFRVSSRSNIDGSINVIDFCKNNQLPLVFASSSAVYGNLPRGDDTSLEIDLISPYAVDKYSMELYAKMAHTVYQLPNIALRFFNVYGERQDPNSQYSGVISVFINQMNNDMEVTIHGGYQTRDFIYVSDVVNSIIGSMKLLYKEPISEQINILTGKSTSIDDLFLMLAGHLDYRKKPNYTDLLVGDPIESGGTQLKLEDLLLWNPKDFTSLQNGLLKTINFQKNK